MKNITFLTLLAITLLLACQREREQAPEAPDRTDTWVEDVLGSTTHRTERTTAVLPDRAIPEESLAIVEALEKRLATIRETGFPEEPEDIERFLGELRSGKRIARTYQDMESLARYQVTAAMLYLRMGYHQVARDACEEAYKATRDRLQSNWPVAARLLQGDIYRQERGISGAMAAYEDAFFLATQREDWNRAERAFTSLQGLFHEKANLAALGSAIESRQRSLPSVAPPHASGQIALWRAFLTLSERGAKSAAPGLKEAVGLFREAGEPNMAAYVEYALAEALIEEEAYSDAIDPLRNALDLAREAGNKRLEAQSNVRLAEIYYQDWTVTHAQLAFDHYRIGIPQAEELGMEGLAIRALTFLGQSLINHHQLRTGTACLLEARERSQNLNRGEAFKSNLSMAFSILRENFLSEQDYEDHLLAVDRDRREILSDFFGSPN